MSKIYSFSEKGAVSDQSVWLRCGKRGQRAFELAVLNLPIVPGFVIDSHLSARLEKENLLDIIGPGLRKIEEIIGRRYGSNENPLLLKLVCSSNLSLPIYPTVFNIGLSPATLPAFAKMLGDEEKAWYEYCYLLRTAGIKLYDIDASKFNEIEAKYGRNFQVSKDCVEEMRNLVGSELLPDDPMQQLELLIRMAAKRYYDPDLEADDNVALMIQGMVFGNLDENGLVGMYCSRDIISGEDHLTGSFERKAYALGLKGEDISRLDTEQFKELERIGKLLEHRFLELREVKFIVEKDKLWLINQTSKDDKSTQSHIRTLLDLFHKKVVDMEWLLQQVTPGQLATLLHPVVDPESVNNFSQVEGGLSGSPGAAVGRVYFSADRLMEAHREALQKGEDTNLILCVVASFAEDVKAIEVGKGVIATEGGYSSHAPVVARSMGKVAMINPDIKVEDKQFSINGKVIKEGEYVTIDVPIFKDPSIYFGKAKLINPDIKKNGLLEFIEIARKFVKPEFVIRANADLPRDAKMARMMGAYGIGLCRTEHMFFSDDRIHAFRQMILSQSADERQECLRELLKVQKQDFYEIFKIMAPHPVTVRLLDAPLHEFLPRNEATLNQYLEYLKGKGRPVDKKAIEIHIEKLHEFNPMLGHRGCRVGITSPEIYEMQVEAILEAAILLKKEGIEVEPEIMVPIVMNSSELNLIRYGKHIEGKFYKGIVNIANEIFEREKMEVSYKVGSMIELPAAALQSDQLALYADFFSYGTNDLTQTTNGLSRDDANSFFPVYTEYDLLPNNPFQVLGPAVKELIYISSSRARLARPDVKQGLCGEHGANTENINFCFNAGLQYVSCSSYSIPIAILAVAQLNIRNGASKQSN